MRPLTVILHVACVPGLHALIPANDSSIISLDPQPTVITAKLNMEEGVEEATPTTCWTSFTTVTPAR